MNHSPVKEIQQTCNENPALAPAIRRLLETALILQCCDIPEEYMQQDEEMLLSFSIVEDSSGYRALTDPDNERARSLALNFNSFLVCHFMLELIQEKAGQPLPDDSLAAICFIQDFLVTGKEADAAYPWYSNLEGFLIRYALIWLNQERGIDVLQDCIRQTLLLADGYANMDPACDTQKMLDIIKLTDTAQEAIPYMNDTVERIFELQVTARKALHYGSYERPMQALTVQHPEKAAALFAYMDGMAVKEEKSVYMHLLIWLCETNPAFYFNKALQFFEEDNENGAWIFANLKYVSSEQLMQVYQIPVDRKQKAEVIANLVASPHCSAELKAVIFQDFLDMANETLAKNADESDWEEQSYQSGLVFNVSQLHGFDEEKMILFPVYKRLYAPGFSWGWFQHAERPDGFFRAIHTMYEEEGEEADLSAWASVCFSIQDAFPGEFTVFLHELQTGDYAYGKKAAATLVSYL